MKKILCAAAVSVWVLSVAGCQGRRPADGSKADQAGIAAVVGGEKITMQELDEAAKSQLQKIETHIYQVKRRVLDSMIETKLVEAAAKKKGMGIDAYLSEEIDAKVTEPAEAEVRNLYDARKGQIKEPFEKVKDRLAAYLKQNEMSRHRQDLLARLGREGDIRVYLEPPRIEIDTGGAPSMGDGDAPVTLVEFSDYQCPFCKRVRPTIWRLMDEYKGKIRYVFFDFPLSFHRQAKDAHEAARCAGDQDKYFEYNRKVFDNQDKIGIPDLKRYAKELRLDAKKFDECLDEKRHSDEVAAAIAKGTNAGVSGTPAFFVNGIMLSGAQPYEAFREVIEGELKR